MADSPANQSERRRAEAEAEVVSRHLPPGYTAEPDALSAPLPNPSASAPDLTDPAEIEEPQDSLKLQGGDIHREIFKIGARAKLQQRSATFAHPNVRRSSTFRPPRDVISHADQRAPGGFRREFMRRQRNGLDMATNPVTRNFVSFLDLYGSFAGEDLAESEDESTISVPEDEAEAQVNETRPLLGRRKSSRRAAKVGTSGTSNTFFTLLKAFIGTGIMFLPKAFNNGGILFSSITLLTVALLSCLCFRLLLQCRERYGGGYGELGAAIGGRKLRAVILTSITLSQVGFVCSGMIFIAQNMFSFLDAVTPDHTTPLGSNALIALQLVVLIPLSLIRNIAKLGPAALLADIFILIGLVYIWYFDISTLSSQGLHPTVELFNPNAFTLTIGSCIFTYEGIGLILPIQSSMARPERFSGMLYIVMVIITIIFTSVGALCYATFGVTTRVEIISNFPQTSKLVNAIQFLYSIAILVGTPVQLFPATRIIETSLFGDRASGKRSSATKWWKNGLRTGLTILCAVIAIAGASDLDKFVALIGSFACVPLVYIYPAFLHYKGIAEGKFAKTLDITVMVVGFGAMVYTTVITLKSWISG
ncbi:vacuolar amino acid transporter 3 [Physcia stellaris]|nr:vacuolar amino acid transporter 3 [Physcia stellaris]